MTSQPHSNASLPLLINLRLLKAILQPRVFFSAALRNATICNLYGQRASAQTGQSRSSCCLTTLLCEMSFVLFDDNTKSLLLLFWPNFSPCCLSVNFFCPSMAWPIFGRFSQQTLRRFDVCYLLCPGVCLVGFCIGGGQERCQGGMSLLVTGRPGQRDSDTHTDSCPFVSPVSELSPVRLFNEVR